MTDIQSLLPMQNIKISKPNANQLRAPEPDRREADGSDRRSESRQESREDRLKADRSARDDERRADRADRGERSERSERSDRANKNDDARASDTAEAQDTSASSALDGTVDAPIKTFEALLNAEMPQADGADTPLTPQLLAEAAEIDPQLIEQSAVSPSTLTGQQLISSTSIAALTAATQPKTGTPSTQMGSTPLAGTIQPGSQPTTNTPQQANPLAAPADGGVAPVGGVDVTAVSDDQLFVPRTPTEGGVAGPRGAPAWVTEPSAPSSPASPHPAAPVLGSVASVATSVQAKMSASPDGADIAVDGEPAPNTNGQSGAGATNSESARANNAATAARDPILAHRAMNQAGMEIARAIQGGRSHFEIKLDPPELGRIEVRMMMDKEKAQARMTVERPETLDMLMRDKTQLERILSASGVELEGGIDLELMDQGGEQASGFEGMLSEDGRPETQAVSGSEGDASGAELEAVSTDVMAAISEAARNPFALNRIA
ncbi:MAG: flagellar hook-length control protein FliK [Pseudomonadota bacterium]